MLFYWNSRNKIQHPEISGKGVILRSPQKTDYEEWMELRSGSRNYLIPWEPTWPSNGLSRSFYYDRVRRNKIEAREDRGYSYFIFEGQSGHLLGGINLSNIRRRASRSCSMGYWTAEKYSGKGFMKAGVEVLSKFAFSSLNLHRIEAACIPENLASRTVLERVGFEKEGFARRYLKINGRWRDHVLYGLIVDDFREQLAQKSREALLGNKLGV